MRWHSGWAGADDGRPVKTRISIRIDDNVLDWVREQVVAAGGGSCQAR